MISWKDIAEGNLPEIGKPVLIYPDWEFGELGENGAFCISSDMGYYEQIAYGFEEPEGFIYKSDVIRYWTEINEP